MIPDDLCIRIDMAIYKGDVVDLTLEEYRVARSYLQDRAGKYIDWGDHVRAKIALDEVRRLDALHGSGL